MKPTRNPLGSVFRFLTSDFWRVASGYTRFVASAKLLLGILVIVLTCAILFYPVIKKNSDVRIAFTSVTKADKPPPTQMVNANFHGFDDNNQPYNVTAKTALQIDEDTVVLDKVNGDITLNSGTWLTVSANKGNLKIQERLLDLSGSVEMFNDEGYELRTELVNINIGKKIAVSHQPVNGQGPLGLLRSSGATFDGNANTTTFSGPVHVTLHLPPKEDGKKPEKKEAR